MYLLMNSFRSPLVPEKVGSLPINLKKDLADEVSGPLDDVVLYLGLTNGFPVLRMALLLLKLAPVDILLGPGKYFTLAEPLKGGAVYILLPFFDTRSFIDLGDLGDLLGAPLALLFP